MWHIHVLGKIQQIFSKEINLCGGGPDILERDKYQRD